MTLGEVLDRLTTMPKVGGHEIVLDRRGVAHILLIVHVDTHAQLGSGLRASVDFMCLCEGMGYETREVSTLEVAKFATCVQCLSR